MKIQTPMNLLKDHFNNLHTVIGEYDTELSKSSPKSRVYHYWEHSMTKGVESDFIRIYDVNNKESFSFIFNGLDGKTGSITATWMTKIKDGKENLYEQRIFNFENFKTHFKLFIQTLEIFKKTKMLNEKSKKETFMSVFNIISGQEEEVNLIVEAVTELPQTKVCRF